jgi:hypothetical protein
VTADDETWEARMTRALERAAPSPVPERKAASPARRKRPPSLARSLKRVAALVTVALVSLAVPALVEVLVPRLLDGLTREFIGHRLVVGRLELDLVNARVIAHDAWLAPAEGGPAIAACEKVEISFDPSRWREGVVIDQVVIDEIRARFERTATGNLDFVERIVRAIDARPKKPWTPVPFFPFAIESARIGALRALVIDKGPPWTEHEEVFSVRVQGLGTIPSRASRDAIARFWVLGVGDVAKHVRLEGEMELPRRTVLDFALRTRGDLTAIDPLYLARPYPWAQPSSRSLDLRARFSVVRVPSGGGDAHVTLTFQDVGLVRDGRPETEVADALMMFETGHHKPSHLRRLRIVGSRAVVARLRDGRIDFAGFVLGVAKARAPGGAGPEPARISPATALDQLEAALASPAAPAEARPGPAGPEVAARGFPELFFGSVEVEGCALEWKDRRLAGEPSLAVTDLTGSIRASRDGANPAGTVPIEGRIAARIEGLARRAELTVHGRSTDRALAIGAAFAVTGIERDALDSYLGPDGPRVVLDAGRLEGRAELELERTGAKTLAGKLALADVLLADRAGERARVARLELPFALDARGKRPRLTIERAEAEASLSVERVADSTTVLGLRFVATGARPAAPAPAREPSIDLALGKANLALGVYFVDRSAAGRPPIHVYAPVWLEARDVRLGEEPGVASFSVDAHAEGLARSLAIEGRALTSFVTPGCVLDARLELDSPVPRAYLAPSGWSCDLEGRTLAGHFAFAKDRGASPAGAIVRVKNVALTDPSGPVALLESASAEIAPCGPDPGTLAVSLLKVEGPRIVLEDGSSGITVARAFTKERAEKGAASTPEPWAERRRRVSTLVIERVRLDHGDLAYIDSAGVTLAVRGILVRAGPLEVGANAGTRPLEVEVAATIPTLARGVRLDATITPPLALPSMRAALLVSGLDLRGVADRLPRSIESATVTDGRFHASVEVRVRALREGGYSGTVALRNVALLADDGHELLGLGEARARILHFDPRTLDLDVASLDLDRPRVQIARERDGSIAAGGLVTRKKVLPFSDEERRLKDANELPPSPPSPPATVARGGGPRLSIERLSVADARLRLTDRSVRNADGTNIVVDFRNIDGTADDLALGALSASGPTTRFEADARATDGMRFTVDGYASRGLGGTTGRVEFELRGLSLPKITRYSENAADVRIERGELIGLAGWVELFPGEGRGEVELVAHGLRLKRLTDNPFAELGTAVAVPASTDIEGDTTLVVPFTSEGVGQGKILRAILRRALFGLLTQPLKAVTRPLEALTSRSLRELFVGRKLEGPVFKEAFFAPGDCQLTEDGARAVASAVEVARHGGRQVRLRGIAGTGDRARAIREVSLSPEDARSLVARLSAERRAYEDERRDLAAEEARALGASSGDRAALARARLEATDAILARIDRSLEELAGEAEGESAAFERGRAEDSLRRLSAERVEVVRRALVGAKVDEATIKVSPPRIHHERDFVQVAGGGGRVTIEVIP